MTNHRDVRTSIEQPIHSGTSDSILASNFRKILHGYGIDSSRFNYILERYIIRANIPRNHKEISSVRGNLKKELTKTTMSWRVFIKGLRFIGVTKFDLIIRIYSNNNDKNDYIDFQSPVILDDSEPLLFDGKDGDD